MKDKDFVQFVVRQVRLVLEREREAGYPEEELRLHLDAVRDFRAAVESDDPWRLARIAMTIGHYKGQSDFIKQNRDTIEASERVMNSSPYTIGERTRAVERYNELIAEGKKAAVAETIVGREFRKNGKPLAGRTLRGAVAVVTCGRHDCDWHAEIKGRYERSSSASRTTEGPFRSEQTGNPRTMARKKRTSTSRRQDTSRYDASANARGSDRAWSDGRAGATASVPAPSRPPAGERRWRGHANVPECLAKLMR